MPLTGTPRSSASWTVQRPVPFCSAWSRTMSTKGSWVISSVCEDLGGDLDQVRVEAAFVPGAERLSDLLRMVTGGVPEQVVGLGDELHVGVLDAVVHHL